MARCTAWERWSTRIRRSTRANGCLASATVTAATHTRAVQSTTETGTKTRCTARVPALFCSSDLVSLCCFCFAVVLKLKRRKQGTKVVGCMRASHAVRSMALSKATRLQLGNVKSEYGSLSTAAGSHEKWGFIYRARKYPTLGHFYMSSFIMTTMYTLGCYQQYRDMAVLTEHICYEDVKDRCLTPMPGWARLRNVQMANGCGPQTFRDPTPLDWLPFELKLGYVKQASY